MKVLKIKNVLIAACVISPLVLFGVVAVLASVWTGPANRTQSTPGACRVIHKHAGTWVCTETCGQPEYHICTAACDAAGGCDSSETQRDPPSITQLPEATVSGTTSCSSPGNNGWCKGVGTLHLSGNEPVSSYSITGFDSDLVGHLCSGSSCTWNFPQGVTAALGYWANSSFGDQSDEAFASMSVDSVSPTLTLTIPSPNGSNSWFTSGPVTGSASATDAISGMASVGINGGGASFTASANGVYNLTATASDKAGNTATTGGTIRLDTTPPSLSVSPAAPNGANNWYVSAAVLTATASDATSGISITQYGVDGGAWQNGSSFSEGVDGTHSIIFRTTDVAGNTTSATPVTVTVDRTPPVPGMSLNPASPNGSNGWYISSVTVAANSSDTTSGLASQAVSLDGSTWKPSVSISTDGTYTLQIQAADNAGNTASSSKTVRLDTTLPTADFVLPPADGENGWYLSSMTVSTSGTDTGSGVASQMVSLDGMTWAPALTLSMDGVYAVHGRVTDNAGNVTNILHTVSIDHAPPVPDASLSPASPDGSNSWYVSSVTITANSSDNTSGIANQGVSLDNTTWKPSITLSTDGTYTLHVQAQDKAGNTASTTRTIKLDNTPPTASFQAPPVDGANNWYVSPITISAVGTDASSGVSSQQVSLDGSTWVSSLTFSEDGVYTVQGQITDNAGNITDINQVIHIDSTPPIINTPELTGTIGMADWYTSSVGISVSATDTTSGVSSTQYSVEGDPWQTTAPILLDGVHSVQIRVIDNAGNVSNTSASAKVDATPPVSAFISPSDGSTIQVSGNHIYHLTGSSSDPTSGISETEISLDGGTTWQPLLLVSDGTWSQDWNSLRTNGTYTIEVRASDIASNQEHTARVTFVVGNQAPSVSITPLWLDFGSASLSFKPGSLPIAGARITVADPLGRWPAAVVEYGGSKLPDKFSWLGKMGDGSIAYVGKYDVTVRVWDSFGNSGTASAWVIIPVPPAKATPTTTPTDTKTTPTPAASSTPIHIAATTTATSLAIPKPTKSTANAVPSLPETKSAPVNWWPPVFITSLFVLFLFLSLLDPRPAAWRRLARIRSNPKS